MKYLLVVFLTICAFTSKAEGLSFHLLDTVPTTSFRPIPKKAALFGLLPGGGQIYTRKYWKLPIIYGALGGAIYAIDFNTKNYKRYKNALFDFQTTRDAEAVGEEYDIPAAFISENSLRSQRDKFNKWRQQSWIFTFIGYFVTIIEGYVVAHLFEFDISDDLSLSTTPSPIIQTDLGVTPAWGVTFSVGFNQKSNKPIKNIFP